MRKATLWTLIPFLILISVLLGYLVYANTVSPVSPTSGQYITIKPFPVICNLQVNDTARSMGYNATELYLYMNTTQTLKVKVYSNTTLNATYNYSTPREVTNRNFTIPNANLISLVDGDTFYYKCGFTITNGSNTVYKNTSVIQAYVEIPTNITMRLPPSGNWSRTRTITHGWRVKANTNAETCQVYSNQSGNWIAKSGSSYTVINNTLFNTSIIWDYDGVIKWGLFCYDRDIGTDVGNWSKNWTIKIDSVNPVISLNGICSNISTTKYCDDTWTRARWEAGNKVARIWINTTITENNPNSCKLYGFNQTTNNATRFPRRLNTTSINQQRLFNLTINSSGQFKRHWYKIECRDNAGNWVNTSFNSYVDANASNIVVPSVEIKRYATGKCDKMQVKFNTSEGVNASVFYGLNTLPATQIKNSTTNVTRHQFYVPFTYNQSEKKFYFNISACDLAGNCRNYTQQSALAPLQVCTGWSAYAITQFTKTNLSDIANQSGAEYVYWFNHSDQSWKFYYPTGGTGKPKLKVNITQAVWLYTSTNSTWVRLNSTTGIGANTKLSVYYNKTTNISRGSNYIGILTLNQTYTFMDYARVFNNTVSGNKNVTYFAYYNNSAQKYVSYIWNWTLHNTTALKRGEVLWIGSDRNFTWVGYANQNRSGVHARGTKP